MIENKPTDFKREHVDDIKYTVVAFANTGGGKIYIGVNDDGSIRGVENADAAMLRITNMIRDSIRLDVTMFTECAVENVEHHIDAQGSRWKSQTMVSLFRRTMWQVRAMPLHALLAWLPMNALCRTIELSHKKERGERLISAVLLVGFGQS